MIKILKFLVNITHILETLFFENKIRALEIQYSIGILSIYILLKKDAEKYTRKIQNQKYTLIYF